MGTIVEVPIDAAWAVGFVLSIVRIATFAVTSPFIGRSIPATGRISFTVGVAIAAVEPVEGVIELGDLLTAAVINAAVGGALGILTGMIIYLFMVAGGVLDLISGLAVSQVFDPVSGAPGGVYTRLFNLTATTLFLVGGGLTLLVSGLVGSVRVLPLDASIDPDPGLGELAIDLVNLLVRSGVELALPIMGVMLMLELALGLAARFAPQANVFMIGLPAKLLTSITVVGAAWTLFPDAMAVTENTFARTFEAVLRGLGA